MNVRTQILVVGVVVVAFIALVDMIRRRKLELKYTLLWFALGVGVLIFGGFPGLTDALAKLVGISTPINMLFFIGFCFSLMIIFSLTVAMSRLSSRVKQLTQEMALIKKEISEKESGTTAEESRCKE